MSLNLIKFPDRSQDIYRERVLTALMALNGPDEELVLDQMVCGLADYFGALDDPFAAHIFMKMVEISGLIQEMYNNLPDQD